MDSVLPGVMVSSERRPLVVVNAASTYQVASSDFVPLAEALLPENQARAFAARWSTLTADEQTQICTMLEKNHG